MSITQEVSSRDTLNSITNSEDRSRTGRYVAGGAALGVTLLALHHALLRGTSSIAGICVPAIIMACYVIWVLYSARRDRRKALRIATAMQLTEVINEPARSTEAVRKNVKNDVDEPDGNFTEKNSHENPMFLKEDNVP